MPTEPEHVYAANSADKHQLKDPRLSPEGQQSETQNLIDAIVLGAFTGVFGGLLAAWIPATLANSDSRAAGVTLTMLMGTPLTCLLGPVAGVLGGLIGGLIARRSSRSALFGAIGGLLAGIGAGVTALWLFGQAIAS
jgi:hypothetical protein